MEGPVLGMALGILLLALPFIVVITLVVVLIWGLRCIARGLSGRMGFLALGIIIVAGCLTTFATLRTWSKTCPADGAGQFDPHRMVYDQAQMMHNHGWAMEATRRGTVIGMKLGGDPCKTPKKTAADSTN